MSFKVKAKVKPPIPPKPDHLSSNFHLPQPPEFSAEKFGLAIGNFIDKNHSKIDNDEGYGYSEAAFESDLEEQHSSQVEQPKDCKRIDGTTEWHSCPSMETTGIKQKEVPEIIVESGCLKDVRQRPLPLLPGEKEQSVADKPWYKVVDRREGEHMVRNGVDGYFLVRPSSKGESCLTLTLWYNGRSYNIPIRKRVDGHYALGTPKDLEQAYVIFCSVICLLKMSSKYHKKLPEIKGTVNPAKSAK